MRIVDHRHRVGEPFKQRMIIETSVAPAVAVHVNPQRGIPDFVERRRDRSNMPLLHVAGKTVYHNDQRAFFSTSVGHVNLCIQTNPVI